MPAHRARLLPLLLAVAACAEAAAPGAPSEEGVPAGDCTSDEACGAGRACVEGACVAETPEVACAFEADPACGEGTLCVPVVDALCAGGDGCAAPTACVAPVGETEGSFRCASDEACRSGLCHEGICLRLCRAGGDCDGTPCVDLPLPRGAKASFCLPVDGAGVFSPEVARCEADRECREGDVCRRVSGNPYSTESRAFCAPFDPSRSPAGAACEVGNRSVEGAGSPDALASDATCQHNTCENGCLSITGVCRRDRCTQPCRTAEDCPARLLCLPFDGPHEDPLLPVHSCWLPFGGCLDEKDCCPELAPDGTCLDTWGLLPTHCAVVPQGARLLSICDGVPGGAAPGTACESDAACGSGLCLEDATGGARRCAWVCDPARDRCEGMTATPGSRCTPISVTLGGVAGSIEVCR